MKYNLSLFDKLIEGSNKGEGIESSIINEIKVSAYRQSSREAIKLHIRNHQIALNECKQHDQLRKQSDEVLYFLETHFYQYLDETLPVSDIGLTKLNNKITDVIAEIYRISATMDTNLAKAIKPLCDPMQPVSIQYTLYMNEFCNKWVQEFNFKEEEMNKQQEEMLRFLITYNYNQRSFFEYLTWKVIDSLHSENDPLMQIEIIRHHLNFLNRIPACTLIAFSNGFESIRNLFMSWLKDELKLCTKKVKNYSADQLNLFPSKEYKIETSLSVAQAAYMAKLMYVSGITVNKSQQDVLQVISKTVRSKKTTAISFDSLQNKYYNVEEPTKESVKEMLLKMLNNIK